MGTLGEARGTVVAVRAECATTAAVLEVVPAAPAAPAVVEGAASVSDESGVVCLLGSAENGSGRRRDVKLGEGGRGVGGRL